MVKTRSQGVLDMLGIDRDVLKAWVSTKELVKLGIAYLVGAEDPKVDGRGLTCHCSKSSKNKSYR